MSGTENTETNVILATGLALVGLLGVAGSLLPPDMLPSVGATSENDAAPAAIESQAAEPSQTASSAATQADSSQSDSGAADSGDAENPVFKPVDLKSISDADPVPGEEKGAEQLTLMESAADAASAVLEVPLEVMKAAEKAFEADPQGEAQRDTPPTHAAGTEPASEPAATEMATAATTAATGEAPAAAFTTAQTVEPVSNPVSQVEREVREAASSSVPAPVQHEVIAPAQRQQPWTPWQARGYQPPPAPLPYPTPQPNHPQYPSQYYGYPQWGAPQR